MSLVSVAGSYTKDELNNVPKSNFFSDNIPPKAILFFVVCLEVNRCFANHRRASQPCVCKNYYSLVWHILNHMQGSHLQATMKIMRLLYLRHFLLIGSICVFQVTADFSHNNKNVYKFF